MYLSTKQLNILTEVAILAAQKAGWLITSFVNANIEVKSKSVGSSLASQVVTEVDVKAQNIILEELKASIYEFDLGLLTEESVDDNSRLEKDYFWCIDPLDGTLAFTEQKSGYSVSIALVSQQGEPVIGVVYNPVDEVLYHTIKGQGVFRNREVFKLKESKSEYFVLTYDRSFEKRPEFDDIKMKLRNVINDFGCDEFEAIQYGGAVMNACYLLEKGVGCYFKLPINRQGGGSLWDFAATTLMFNEIGAYVSDIYGNSLDLNRSDTVFMNSKGVLFATSTHIAEKVLSQIS